MSSTYNPQSIEEEIQKKWDQEKVQFILNKTYDLEIKIKSGSYSNPNLLIKKLLIDICETATS